MLTIEQIKKRCEIKPNGCWEWKGARAAGYGRVKLGRQVVSVHRVVAQMVYGIKRGQDACHRCDNKICCNPEHLFVGTRSDNMKDAARKGRLPMAGRPSRVDGLPRSVVANAVKSSSLRKAAASLGVSRRLLRQYVKKHGIPCLTV